MKFHFLKRFNLAVILGFTSLLLVQTNDAFAYGIPGAPAINTVFGSIIFYSIVIVEFMLSVSLVFALWRARHGHPEEQGKILWHVIIMILVFLTPEIFNLAMSLFTQSGGRSAQSNWNG